MNSQWTAAVLILSLAGLCQITSARKSNVITITSDNWRRTLEGEWVIKFFATWCPACKNMEADFRDFADWSDDLNIQVAEVNINDEAGLSGRFIVTALPTIYHAKNGEFRRYAGHRDSNALHKYIEEQMWRNADPVAWYRHPDSVLMSLMAGLFQTSVLIKNFHETLTETYGFSSMASYIIFGVATIATGLILGLILVFIIDCVSPPKPRGRPPQSALKDEKDEGEEEEAVAKESAEEEEEGEDEDGQSTGRESVSGSEKEEKKKRGSKDGSSEEEEGRGSQASSKSSSRTSQEWEQVQGAEVEEAEQSLDVEREIVEEKEEEEGQGEVRRRNITKPNEEEEKQ